MPRACFATAARATLVAKYLDGREAELFTIPLDPPSPLLRPAQPVDRPVAGIHRARDGCRSECGRDAAGRLLDDGHARVSS